MSVRRVLVSLMLVSAAGCQSFEKLRSGDATVGEEEVHAAGRSSDAALTEDLHHLLAHRESYSTEVVVAAIQALADRGDPASVGHIALISEDSSEEVRWHVAVALAKIGGDQARQVLSVMAKTDPSEMVREEAALFEAAR